MIKVIDNKPALLEYQQSWEELYNEDLTATPFQRFAYVYSSIDFCLNKTDILYIIAIKDAQLKKWVFFSPLYIDKKGVLRFINARHTDFCRPLLSPDSNIYNLFKEFSNHITTTRLIKTAIFDNIEISNPLISSLKPNFRYLICYDINHYSTISIYHKHSDKSPLDALRGLPSKRKGGLKKILKEKASNCEFRFFQKKVGDAYPKESIDLLINDMLEKGIRVRDYFSDTMINFWHQLYEEEILVVAILFQENKAVACSFLFYNAPNTEYIEWIILYADKTWNVTLCLKIEEYMYANYEKSTINFARGIYDYKLTNFHPDVKPLFCVRIAKTPWGHIKNMLATAFHYSKPIIKTLLRR